MALLRLVAVLLAAAWLPAREAEAAPRYKARKVLVRVGNPDPPPPPPAPPAEEFSARRLNRTAATGYAYGPAAQAVLRPPRPFIDDEYRARFFPEPAGFREVGNAITPLGPIPDAAGAPVTLNPEQAAAAFGSPDSHNRDQSGKPSGAGKGGGGKAVRLRAVRRLR